MNKDIDMKTCNMCSVIYFKRSEWYRLSFSKISINAYGMRSRFTSDDNFLQFLHYKEKNKK